LIVIGANRCLCVCSVWRGMLDSTQNTCTNTKCYAAVSPLGLFTFLTHFKISDFNKEHPSYLKMI